MLDVHCHDELFGDTMIKMKNLHQDGIISGISKEVNTLLPKVPLIERVLERVVVSQFVQGLECRLKGSVHWQ